MLLIGLQNIPDARHQLLDLGGQTLSGWLLQDLPDQLLCVAVALVVHHGRWPGPAGSSVAAKRDLAPGLRGQRGLGGLGGRVCGPKGGAGGSVAAALLCRRSQREGDHFTALGQNTPADSNVFRNFEITAWKNLRNSPDDFQSNLWTSAVAYIRLLEHCSEKQNKEQNLWQSAPDRCCSDKSLYSSGESAAAAEQEAAGHHPPTVTLDSYLWRQEKDEKALVLSDGRRLQFEQAIKRLNTLDLPFPNLI